MSVTQDLECTVASPVLLSGRGYWSGKLNQIRLMPAGVGQGRYFVRDDLPGSPAVPAHIDFRIEANRRTVLSRNNVRVEMTEHLLAALYGLGVDNCAIHLTADEIPAFDGSSQAYVDAIKSVGLERQPGLRKHHQISQRLEARNGPYSIQAAPGMQTLVDYTLTFPAGHVIPNQGYCFAPSMDGIEELSSARTFVTEQEAEQIRQAGLAKHVTTSDLLIFSAAGPINNTLRFPDECARHKVLDLIGDLALCGFYWHGEIIAHGSGHGLNAELALQMVNAARSKMSRAG